MDVPATEQLLCTGADVDGKAISLGVETGPVEYGLVKELATRVRAGEIPADSASRAIWRWPAET